MAYPDFPFPKHLPSFLSTEEVGKYLKDYADHFDLMKSIRVDHEVVSVQPMQDNDGKQTWKVVVKNLRNDMIHTNVFDAVVVCNG
jgi:cation diffusion facilitator CzcD-associated flavoprotein CzcO